MNVVFEQVLEELLKIRVNREHNGLSRDRLFGNLIAYHQAVRAARYRANAASAAKCALERAFDTAHTDSIVYVVALVFEFLILFG